ncbi:septal ring lytic transglycosylase RlpA family protein [Chromobacterium haemolyticum]|nr:septal ring lytic transglycosylase RlpA family protein [Chromobacterium haemolyticum]
MKTASATNQSASSSTGNKKTVAKNGAFFQNDGPADHIPVNLNLVPDAVPQEEPLIKSANLPYTALGMSFRPDTREKPYQATGRASWYGKQFHGRKTSSGEKYDMFAMTAAHPTLPIPSYARVTNLNNGKSVVVRVNDRGPFHKNRLMDLSYAAAYRLGFVKQGSAKIAIERVWPDAGGENIASTRPVNNTARRVEDTPKYLQLGSFSKLANAEAMVQKMLGEMDDKYESKLGIVNQEGVYKVRLGPFRSSDAVRNAAENLHVETVVTSL